MYKHWKKILLAMTAFFWNACDNNSTPTAPQITPNSSSGTNVEPTSSSATPPPVSSAVGETSSSSVTAKSSSAVAPSSSSVKEKVSSSSKGMIAPKYGVPVMSSSSQGFEAVPLYGVVSNVCVKSENDSTLSCNGVTCVESVTETTQIPSCSGDQICAKYGVVVIRDKTYKCDDGKVYNEAEFKARYDILTVVENDKKKIPCYKNGDSMECDDGEFYDILKDDKGNVIYSNDIANLSEKDFLKKYEILEMAPVLYGPPCMFNGTCDEEK